MTSLSDEDCPFSEYERRAQASVIDVLSPNLSQTRLFPKFTLLEQHQPYRSLAGILGGKNVGTPTGTIDEHVGEASMFADRTYDGTVSLVKQAMGDGGLLEPGFFLF